VEQKFLQSVDAFIYNSQTTRSVVESLLNGPAPHVVALPSGSRFSGMPTALITQRAAQPRRLQIVFLGNLIPRKGLHTLLAALARLPADVAQLTIIGDKSMNPGYVRSVQHQIDLLDLSSRTELTGNVTDAALNTQLSDADVLVLPSSYEGFGIVYLEGMAFGLPAIGTTSGAAREIITPGLDGFLIEPGDADALANRLQMLASDRKRLQEMSLAARRRYDSHPTWEESMARIVTFLRSLSS
jgi:glycosyltransferase involved in cell wall biosynthesis